MPNKFQEIIGNNINPKRQMDNNDIENNDIEMWYPEDIWDRSTEKCEKNLDAEDTDNDFDDFDDFENNDIDT
jgi:hypothetical protein